MNGISCIVCAYNEADRIKNILDAAVGHAALLEVIVVNDGSTDATDALLQTYPSVRVVSYRPNRGKTYAMSLGVAAARGDQLMFLDADLAGLTGLDIERLAAPVRRGVAEVSMSLRRNSLSLYRRMGLDFVSGERVIPAWLVRDQVAKMQTLPRWGAETFINELVIAAGLRIEVIDWRGVYNIRKHEKVGAFQGLMAECGMIADALKVASPLGIVRQNFGLLQLVNGSPLRAARRAWRRGRIWPEAKPVRLPLRF